MTLKTKYSYRDFIDVCVSPKSTHFYKGIGEWKESHVFDTNGKKGANYKHENFNEYHNNIIKHVKR